MSQIVLNVVLTSVSLSFVLWLSKTNPTLGGFILSMPLSTLITLAFSKIQNENTGNTMLLAKSIFIGIPSTLTFFIPFLLAERFNLSFWTSYTTGFLLLSVSFFKHRYVVNLLG